MSTPRYRLKTTEFQKLADTIDRVAVPFQLEIVLGFGHELSR
jgi:hypothetical protein